MSKISRITSTIIGLSLLVGSQMAFAEPGMDIDTFSIAQIGTFVDTVQANGQSPALKHENPAVLRIESEYRKSSKSEVAKTLQQENLLNYLQMNEHAVYVQLKF